MRSLLPLFVEHSIHPLPRELCMRDTPLAVPLQRCVTSLPGDIHFLPTDGYTTVYLRGVICIQTLQWFSTLVLRCILDVVQAKLYGWMCLFDLPKCMIIHIWTQCGVGLLPFAVRKLWANKPNWFNLSVCNFIDSKWNLFQLDYLPYCAYSTVCTVVLTNWHSWDVNIGHLCFSYLAYSTMTLRG